MLVFCLHQKGNGARDQDQDVEDNVTLGHLFHPIGGHGVDQPCEHGQSCHHTNCRICGNLVIEIRSHRNGCEKHLCCTVFRRRHTSDLSKKIDPSSHPRFLAHLHISRYSVYLPAQRRYPWLRCESRNGEISDRENVSNNWCGGFGEGSYKPPDVGYAETNSATDNFQNVSINSA